jgi:hypothetical protein
MHAGDVGGGWFASVAVGEAARSVFTAASEGGASWGELLRRLVDALWPAEARREGEGEGKGYDDDPDCPNVLCMLASALGNSVVCPRWVTTHGWCWSIPREAIIGYPVTISTDEVVE